MPAEVADAVAGAQPPAAEAAGESKAKYREETGEAVSRWLADTPVQFVPHGKRPGTKSYERYEKYSRAKTIKEILDLGAKPEDLVHDFEKKLFKTVGGPMRDTKLDPAQITDASGLSQTDMILLQQLAKCKGFEGRAQALSKLKVSQKFGVSADSLRKGNWCETPAMMGARMAAAKQAKDVLQAADAEGRGVTHAEVLSVLRLWKFRANGTRVDVMQEGVTKISCDRMGIQMKNGDHAVIQSQETIHYSEVLKLLCRFLKDNPPAGMEGKEFPFTSVFLNAEYCCRRHRDKQNVGPTVVVSFGDFTGGALEYWQEDDKSQPVPLLEDSDKVMLDICNKTTLIDGNRAHAVEEYAGKERFSLVFYTAEFWERTSDEVKKEMTDIGVAWPTTESLEAVKKLLPPPAGYGESAAKAAKAEKRPADKRPQASGLKASKEMGKKGKTAQVPAGTVRHAQRWLNETKISFSLEGKSGSPVCDKRFEKYSQAKTIGEAINLGAKPSDLLHDFTHRLFKPSPAGPWRSAIPLRLVPAKNRTAVDKYLLSMKSVNPSGSTKFTSTFGKRTAAGDVELSGKRAIADELAEKVLKDLQEMGRKVTDKEVTEVLRRWQFHKNEARQNVIPEGESFVYSDTLGLVNTRMGTYVCTRATREYPNVARLLNRWLKDRRPPEMQEDFCFTSISLNAGYAAKRHRDGNNAGPSMIRAFGRFQGGKLGYWPEDNKEKLPNSELSKLPVKERIDFAVDRDLVLFDGNRAHEVSDFDGERFSVVWFCGKGFSDMNPETTEQLKGCDFVLPTQQRIDKLFELLPAPRGYDGQRIDSLFGAKIGDPPKVYSWFTEPDAEEEKRAAKVIADALRPPAPTSPQPKDKGSPKSGEKLKRARLASGGPMAKKGRFWGGPLAAALKKGSGQKGGVKRKAAAQPTKGQEEDVDSALALLKQGMAALAKAAKASEGGSGAVAARVRVQLMRHMADVARFAGSE